MESMITWIPWIYWRSNGRRNSKKCPNEWMKNASVVRREDERNRKRRKEKSIKKLDKSKIHERIIWIKDWRVNKPYLEKKRIHQNLRENWITLIRAFPEDILFRNQKEKSWREKWSEKQKPSHIREGDTKMNQTRLFVFRFKLRRLSYNCSC
jgi:hypothetical protein